MSLAVWRFGRCGGRRQSERKAFRMLFLVISEPRPERPSGVTAARQSYWTWTQAVIDAQSG
jgi:hypothetical protein